jgi:CTP-dependent riboflavin kinase
MTRRVLSGRVLPGLGDAANWPMDDILKTVASCFDHLEKGTLNVTLDEPYTLRPDFKLLKDERSDRGTRPEDLSFECCRLGTGTGSLKALIARTSTNHHGDAVLEIMAAENLRNYFGLKDDDQVHIEIWVATD